MLHVLIIDVSYYQKIVDAIYIYACYLYFVNKFILHFNTVISSRIDLKLYTSYFSYQIHG